MQIRRLFQLDRFIQVEPLLGSDALGQAIIDEWIDQGGHGLFYLGIFVLASISALSRKMTLRYCALEQFRIGAIGQAQEIIEPLHRQTVRVGERILLSGGGRGVARVFVGDACQETTGIAFVGLQPEIGGKLIGGVLLTSKDRHLVVVEYSVPHLMEEDIDQRSNDGIHARYAVRGCLLRRIFQDAVEILITDRDGVIRVPSIFFATASFNGFGS